VQLVFPLLVWTRYRVAIVIAAELLHLGIAIFLGLWLFSGIMIVLNAAAFGESIWRTVAAWLAPRVPARRFGKVVVVYAGGCPFCSDYVVPGAQGRRDVVELVDARTDAERSRATASSVDLEDGMVVIKSTARLSGRDAAVHQLAPRPRRATGGSPSSRR
jgi:hypothetical protein